MRVLLLNPPSQQVVLRDYLCSKTTKASYLYPPIDLVMLSGKLSEEHRVEALDCVARGLSAEQARARIEAFRPDVIVSLVASVSWREDRAFLASLSRRDRRVVVLGDVLHEESVPRLEHEPWIDAALHDFMSDDLDAYLAGRLVEVTDMTLRDTRGRAYRVRRKAAAENSRSRPVRPRHELFATGAYRFPFARKAPFAALLTDYGCPWPCSFCVMSTLEWSRRPLGEVLDEIDGLRARGVHELFVLDQTFGHPRRRAIELCSALEERGDLSWTAFTRPDTADDELLVAMRAAGCHTVILGVESADDELLQRYEKGYTVQSVRSAFARAHGHGLRTVGTLMVGLPEQDQSSLERSLELALELDMDFLSLNVAVPRFGTPFRQRAIELGLARAEELVMDQSGGTISLPTLTLDRAEVQAAKRRMNRRFYLRPHWLLRRLMSLRSPFELRTQLREGMALLTKGA